MAAQALNETKRAIYGIVTDAEVWQFGRLVDAIFTRNLTRTTIDDLPRVFGAVYGIMELATANGG